jgi:penicillin-binding protein 1C
VLLRAAIAGALRPDRQPKAASAARSRVLVRLQAAGILTPASAAEAASAPIPAGRLPAALDAPHLAERLVAAAPGRSEIASLIDGDLQRRLQALAARQRQAPRPARPWPSWWRRIPPRRRAPGVGAGLLDTGSRSQNDMVRAIRSPGSTLKPFVMACL